MNCVVGDICLLLLGREQFPSFSRWECLSCDIPLWGVTLRGRPDPICAHARAALLFFFFGLQCHFSEEKLGVVHHLFCKLIIFYLFCETGTGVVHHMLLFPWIYCNLPNVSGWIHHGAAALFALPFFPENTKKRRNTHLTLRVISTESTLFIYTDNNVTINNQQGAIERTVY